MRAPFTATLVVLATATTSQGVITNGDPLERPGNAYIGAFQGGSAVAIGEHFLLTAAHVRGRENSPIFMGDDTFFAQSVTQHPTADLALIEVAESLPGWHSVTSDVERGDRLVFGGFGLTEERRSRGGYLWSNERAEVWGENELSFTHRDFGVFDFDGRRRAALPSEAIFTPGDSGGGVFVEGEDGTLDLAGIAVGVTGRFGESRFGNLGVFLTLGETLEAFGLDLVPFESGTIGPVQLGLVDTPTPGTAALLALAGATLPARRRRA